MPSYSEEDEDTQYVYIETATKPSAKIKQLSVSYSWRVWEKVGKNVKIVYGYCFQLQSM